eukprot:3256149-Amphidinium_carterae.1
MRLTHVPPTFGIACRPKSVLGVPGSVFAPDPSTVSVNRWVGGGTPQSDVTARIVYVLIAFGMPNEGQSLSQLVESEVRQTQQTMWVRSQNMVAFIARGRMRHRT